MDSACVSLDGCSVSGNKGPGLDLSGAGHALVADCTVKGNCGGVFLWDDSKCVLQARNGCQRGVIEEITPAAVTFC